MDRKAREYLLGVVDGYLSGALGSVGYLERIEALPRTRDHTAKMMVEELSLFAGDVTTYFRKLSKAEWDYLQRLCLVLRSDVEFAKRARRPVWNKIRVLAVAQIMVLAFAAYQFGVYGALLVSALISSCDVLLLHRLRPKSPGKLNITQRSPFTSFAQLRACRMSTHEFRKVPYPAAAIARMPGPKPSKNRFLLNMLSVASMTFWWPVFMFGYCEPSEHVPPVVE